MCVLLTGISGAWGQTTVKVAAFDEVQPWAATGAYITRSADKLTLTTTATSGGEGLVLQSSGKTDDGYWDRSGNWLLLIPKNKTESTFTITIAAPSGYAITSYSIDFCSWDSNRTYVVTAEDGTSKTAGNTTIQTLSLSSLSTRTTSITVKANECSTNNYFTIKNMTVTLASAPNIPNGDYLINIQKTDATNYNSFIQPNIEQLFTSSYQNVSTAGVFNLTRVEESYDTYYIKELSSGKYLYAVNADKADYDNNGKVTTYGASSSYKYRFRTGTYSETLMKAIDLGETSLPEGDKTAYQWKILPSPISANHLNIIPCSNTKTSLGMWTSSDTYYSFLEPSYGWSQVKFYSMEDATQAYLSYNNVESKIELAGKVGYPKLDNDYLVALNGLMTVFGEKTFNSTHFSNLKTCFQEYLNTTDVIIPSIGKFYTIYNPNANKYIHSVNPDNTLALNASGTSADAIFYVIDDNTRFLSYSNGYAMGGIKIWNTTYPSGGYYTYSIDHVATQDFGTLRFNYNSDGTNYSFYQNGSTVGNTSQPGTRTGVKAAWTFTEVTSLPVTITAAKYATLCAPVALTIPSGVKAYYISELTSTEATLAEISTTIAAGTPVILMSTDDYTDDEIAAGGKTYTFAIATGGTDVSGYNKLSGQTATFSVSADDVTNKVYYTLQQNAAGKAVGLFPKTAAGSIAGFKAYLLAEKLPALTKGLAFKFEDVDGIDKTLEEKAGEGNDIYNLAGQRMSRVQKGVNIVNGKKVLVK